MKRKSRKAKEKIYKEKYDDIPRDFQERLGYMYDKYNLTEKKQEEIIKKKETMELSLYYKDIYIKLFEEPEGTPRPRFRIVNRKNLAFNALNNGQFVHVYSLNAKEDHVFMERMVDENQINELNNLIYTPCIIDFTAYLKTPSSFNITDTFLAELGLIRPISKPDWDNVGKKYSDMFNANIWLDDSLVITGTVSKYYSILPRVELRIRYLNTLYNKYQYLSINKKITEEADYFGRNQKWN